MTETPEDPPATANQPPEFQTDVNVFQIVFKTNVPEAWSYSLPASEDADGDDIEMTVDVQLATFVTFDGIDKINIADMSDSTVEEGEYKIEVTLDDGTDTTSEVITLNIMPALEEDEEEDKEGDVEDIEEPQEEQ